MATSRSSKAQKNMDGNPDKEIRKVLVKIKNRKLKNKTLKLNEDI